MVISDSGKFRRGVRMPAFLAIKEKSTWTPMVDASGIFLFLDFDGTLAEIAPRPNDVYLNSRRKECLRELVAVPEFSVAVISGRPVDDLTRLIGVDGLFYVGNHGSEWLAPNGAKNACVIAKPVADALTSLRDQFGCAGSGARGVFLEDKGTALALHYRMASEDVAVNARSEFVRAVHRHQRRGVALEILSGKEVIEAKPAATNKGEAAEYLLKRFGGGALPVYCGDDLTDEFAFHRLNKRGITILVAETPRSTAASFYLRNPNEMYEFLQTFVRVWKSK
jgi:trehalose-phosphatase